MPETQSDNEELTQSDLFKNPEDDTNPLLVPPDEKKEEPVGDVDEGKLTKRMERRQAEKIRQLRDENIALAERLKIIAEQKQSSVESDVDYLKEAEQLYGNADENGVFDPKRAKATEIFKSVVSKAVADAERRAIERFEARQQESSSSEKQAIEENESFLDEAMADIEEEYGIDMDVPKERNGYLDLLEEMSPKDSDGNIIEYADPDAVAKVYMKIRTSSNSQAKQIASRSMARSAAGGDSTVAEDATLRWLKENNLL
jgi:hypothetical protein